MKVFSLTKVPQFMTELFSGTFFDEFNVNRITIKNGPSTVIEGRISREEEEPRYCLYSSVKKIAYECVKGKTLPEFMKFVLTAPEKMAEEYGILQGESLSITLSFKDNELMIMSGAFLKDPFPQERRRLHGTMRLKKCFHPLSERLI